MKKGFTLAEVLITLAIIGVVAALTIPVVVHKYQQQQLYTQFMKVYNTFSNVLSLTSLNEDPIVWNYDPSDMNEFFDKHLAPYLKIAKRGTVEEIFVDSSIKTLNGGNFPYSISDLHNLFGGADAVLLNDGTTLAFLKASGDDIDPDNRYFQIMFDTNGTKGPDIIGRDRFMMELGYYTDGDKKKSYFGLVHKEYSCDPNGPDVYNDSPQGTGCPIKLLKEGKMDY